MYIVRDIFHLKFGHFRDAKSLLDEAMSNKLMPQQEGSRVLSDFTGDAYRLILEQPFKTLADYEQTLQGNMAQAQWQSWYMKFRDHVDHSCREILKQVM